MDIQGFQPVENGLQRDNSAIMDKIGLLFTRMNKDGIDYCHWKSNYHLLFALSGNEDLDLLVKNEDFDAFISILTELGFKQAISIAGFSQPGVYHYLGHDEVSGSMVHVHAFRRILTGDSLLKSYALPMEKMLLDNIRFLKGIKVPSKNSEMVAFVLRHMIKLATLPDLIFSIRRYKPIMEEYFWLKSEVNQQALLSLLDQYFPKISKEKFVHAMEAFAARRGVLKRIYLGWVIKKRLAMYRRYNIIEILWQSTIFLLIMLSRKIFQKEKYKNLLSGGSIIAFVGPQATGKSTLSILVKKWLGEHLSVRYIHAGKPPSTWLTSIPNSLLPLFRKFLSSHRSTEIEKRVENEEHIDYSLIHLFRKIFLAYDRRSLLNRSFRQSRKGKIIIADRYPSETVGAVDGASFSDETIRGQNLRIKRLLMKIERSIYQQISPPDLVIQLSVPVELAVHRNQVRDKIGPRDSEYVRFRHKMKMQPAFSRPRVINISTGQSLDKTLTEVKRIIWKNI